MTIRTSSLLVLIMACSAPAFAQDDLRRAKELYAAAAYEEALAVLKAVPEAERIPQVDEYRAFCLIALGQGEEAQQAIADLLATNPLYQPDSAETSPRVVEAFAAARERALPIVAKQLYVDAKAALERKERDEAVAGFERLLRAIDSAPELKTTFEDLRVLADGFLTLSRALPEPATEPVPETALPAPNTSAVEPTTAAFTPPVAVKQEIPPWIAADPISRRQTFSGTLRLRVGADGRIESAEIVEPVHPAYDKILLAAAHTWVYQPATENGVPLSAEVTVQIHLRPPAP